MSLAETMRARYEDLIRNSQVLEVTIQHAKLLAADCAFPDETREIVLARLAAMQAQLNRINAVLELMGPELHLLKENGK